MQMIHNLYFKMVQVQIVCLFSRTNKKRTKSSKQKFNILYIRLKLKDPPRKKRRYRYHVHITPYSITLLVVNFEKCCCENWIVRICTLINFIAPVYMVHWYMFIKTFTYAGQSKQKGFFLSWKKLNELTSCLAEVNSQTVDSAF